MCPSFTCTDSCSFTRCYFVPSCFTRSLNTWTCVWYLFFNCGYTSSSSRCTGRLCRTLLHLTPSSRARGLFVSVEPRVDRKISQRPTPHVVLVKIARVYTRASIPCSPPALVPSTLGLKHKRLYSLAIKMNSIHKSSTPTPRNTPHR